VVLAAVIYGLAYGAILAKSFYDEHRQMWVASRPYRAALFTFITTNDFSAEFIAPEDREVLKKRFGELVGKTEEETVENLVGWVNKELKTNEVPSVRAAEILKEGTAACEVHGFAVGVLSALGIRARWIGGASTSIGFGYLEAFVDGRWRLFKLRDPDHTSLGVSALELYRASEPGLNVRAFYPLPGVNLHSWRGTVGVAVLPLANIERHPELETLFNSDRGVALDWSRFDPYAYIFTWFPQADDLWIKQKSTLQKFEEQYAAWRAGRRREKKIGPLRFHMLVPADPIPSSVEIGVTLF
jgi:hypothetical protein